jgi:hypothetical protein
MWEGDCGALPVVDDDGKFIGMITDRDICMAIATRPQLANDIILHTEEGGDKGIPVLSYGEVLSSQKATCEHRYPKSAYQQGAFQKVTHT